jgi:hypothetical protein
VFFVHKERIKSMFWRSLLAVSLSWLLLCSILGCRAQPQVRTVLVHSLKCLDQPPPNLRTIQSQKLGCPEEYVCLSGEDAVFLQSWVQLMVYWAQEAWTRCGPVQKAEAENDAT